MSRRLPGGPLTLLATVLLIAALGAALTIILGREREEVSVSARLQANAEEYPGFTMEDLTASVTADNWFDGGGSVGSMMLIPNGGQISLGFCSSELLDAVLTEWSSYVVARDQVGGMLLIYLRPVDALWVTASEQDPSPVRLFPGAGSHKVAIFGNFAELQRTRAHGRVESVVDVGYDLFVRDYETVLTMNLTDNDAATEPPQLSGKTGFVAEAECWGLILQGTNYSPGGSGELVRFSGMEDPVGGVKGTTDHLSLQGVTGTIFVGDRQTSFDVPLDSLSVRFSQGVVFGVSFAQGDLFLTGKVESVSINGVEQVQTKWVPWAVTFREIIIAVFASVAGAVAAVAATAALRRQRASE